jgi:NADH-quinone oxidoreductase subunit D
MPEGPAPRSINKIVPPKRGEMKRSMEALIHHFKLYTEGFHVPAGEVYARGRKRRRASSASISSPTAPTSPTAARSAPTGLFRALQAMDFMMKGHMLADTTAVLGAMDIVFGECDR